MALPRQRCSAPPEHLRKVYESPEYCPEFYENTPKWREIAQNGLKSLRNGGNLPEIGVKLVVLGLLGMLNKLFNYTLRLTTINLQHKVTALYLFLFICPQLYPHLVCYMCSSGGSVVSLPAQSTPIQIFSELVPHPA